VHSIPAREVLYQGPRCRGRRDAATELVVGNLTSYFILANERAGLFRRAYRRVARPDQLGRPVPAVHRETAFPPPLRASIAVLLSHVVDPFCFMPGVPHVRVINALEMSLYAVIAFECSIAHCRCKRGRPEAAGVTLV
jgi:hypothetical protein